jgi:hypothetical protein
MTNGVYIPLKKQYWVTFFALIFAGLIWTIAYSVLGKDTFHVFMVGLLGSAMAIAACGAINLLYLLPNESLFLRLVAPGIASLLLLLILFKSSPVDMLFFTFFGIVNLGLGLFWYVSILRIIKQSK